MANSLAVGPTLEGTNRLIAAQPFRLCMPFVAMYVALWTIVQGLRLALPRGLYLSIFLVCCGLLPIMEFWLVVLVSMKALPQASTRAMSSVVAEVKGLPGVWNLVFRLYARLCGWSVAAIMVAGTIGFVALVVSFVLHPQPRQAAGTHHASHPTAIWLLLMLWSVTLGVLFSRYLFALPSVALLQQAPQDLLARSIGLARMFRWAVIATALAEFLFVTLPISGLEHFSRPHLQAVRFAWPAMQLATAVLSGIAATWFTLFKLSLTQQAWALVNRSPVGS